MRSIVKNLDSGRPLIRSKSIRDTIRSGDFNGLNRLKSLHSSSRDPIFVEWQFLLPFRPYAGIKGKNSFKFCEYDIHRSSIWRGILDNYAELAQLAQKVLNPGDSLLTYVGHHLIFKVNDLIRNNSDLIYHWQIIVRHEGPKSRVHPYKIRACYKPLLWYYRPNIDANGKDRGPTMYHDVRDLVESKAVLKDNHEWEQSMREAKHMIEPLTVEGNTVLDPFMGSGTTGLASLELNRRFIGIEIEKSPFIMAKARLQKLRPKTRGRHTPYSPGSLSSPLQTLTSRRDYT